MRAIADVAQQPLINFLEKHGAEYRSFWIANALWVRTRCGSDAGTGPA